MNRKPQEISNILKEQIRNYQSKIEMTETGTVVMVGDGIATVYGIKNCMAGELLEFSDGSVGLAQNLEEETVSVAILANTNNICEGTTVKRTGQVLSVPVGEGMLGRVVNALGEPIDGKGDIHTTQMRPIESEAPGIIERKSVSVPLQTGIKAIDRRWCSSRRSSPTKARWIIPSSFPRRLPKARRCNTSPLTRAAPWRNISANRARTC